MAEKRELLPADPLAYWRSDESKRWTCIHGRICGGADFMREAAAEIEKRNRLLEKDADCSNASAATCNKCENERGANMSIERYRIEADEKWHELSSSMPWISFPPDWQVSIIPPFAGATARFLVRLPGMGEKDRVSVYADHYGTLGYFSEPYWEVYPYQGDTGRCAIGDVAKLLEMIGDRRNPENGSCGT